MTMQSSINIGIVGYGFMGHEHEKMLSELDGFQVVAIADIDPDQLRDIPKGITSYNTADALFADNAVHVVIISANNNQHHDLVIKAAKAGKDVICEKPVAMNPMELDEMEHACDKYGVKFTVHHQRRFDPDFRSIKNIYDSGTLGNIYSVKSSLYGFNGNMHDWHVFINEGGGMLYDWGVHLLDQMLWMIPGKIKTVFADVRNVINSEVDDYFKILMRFDNNITAEVELGTYYLSNEGKWFERHWFIAGDKGTAYSNGFNPVGSMCHTTHLLTNVGGTRTMTAAGPTRSFGPPPEGTLITKPLPVAQTQHSDFFENYRQAYFGKTPFIVQISETRRVLRLMHAIRESARSWNSIDFE